MTCLNYDLFTNEELEVAAKRAYTTYKQAAYQGNLYTAQSEHAQYMAHTAELDRRMQRGEPIRRRLDPTSPSGWRAVEGGPEGTSIEDLPITHTP